MMANVQRLVVRPRAYTKSTTNWVGEHPNNIPHGGHGAWEAEQLTQMAGHWHGQTSSNCGVQ